MLLAGLQLGAGGCPWGVGCKGRASPMAGTGQSRVSMRVFCAGRRDGPPSLPHASSPRRTPPHVPDGGWGAFGFSPP